MQKCNCKRDVQTTFNVKAEVFVWTIDVWCLYFVHYVHLGLMWSIWNRWCLWPLVFWYFQGIQKKENGTKWVKVEQVACYHIFQRRILKLVKHLRWSNLGKQLRFSNIKYFRKTLQHTALYIVDKFYSERVTRKTWICRMKNF